MIHKIQSSILKSVKTSLKLT